jgi:hypothetical protein
VKVAENEGEAVAVAKAVHVELAVIEDVAVPAGLSVGLALATGLEVWLGVWLGFDGGAVGLSLGDAVAELGVLVCVGETVLLLEGANVGNE